MLLPSTIVLFALTCLGSLATAGLFNPVTRVSPECKPINSGQLLCCAMNVTGDQPIVVTLATLTGYNLNPNDVNGIACE
jgi:hypothetical protein